MTSSDAETDFKLIIIIISLKLLSSRLLVGRMALPFLDDDS